MQWDSVQALIVGADINRCLQKNVVQRRDVESLVNLIVMLIVIMYLHSVLPAIVSVVMSLMTLPLTSSCHWLAAVTD